VELRHWILLAASSLIALTAIKLLYAKVKHLYWFWRIKRELDKLTASEEEPEDELD